MAPSVDNFVHSLVEMARALEAEPRLNERIAELEAEVRTYLATIQRLELKAIDRKNEIDTLNAKIRSLEVERDEALFRTLEAEDTKAAVMRTLRDIQSSAATLIEALDPAPRDVTSGQFVPRTETPTTPQPVTVPLDESGQSAGVAVGQSESPPIVQVQSAETGVPVASTGATTKESVSPPTTTEQSPVIVETPKAAPEVAHTDPTVATTTSGESVSAPSTTVEPSATVAPSEPTPGPYSGKRYRDIPNYVTLEGWLAGGGAKEDYYGVWPNPTAAQ